MSFATAADGTKIYYRDIGDPKAESTVIMIQGLGLSSQFWFDIPDKLAADPKNHDACSRSTIAGLVKAVERAARIP